MSIAHTISFQPAVLSPININGLGDIWGVSVIGDNSRMIFCSTTNLYFATYNVSTHNWNTPVQFGAHNVGYAYIATCVTQDGLRVMASDYNNGVSVYVWNGATYTNRQVIPSGQGFAWCGLACTSNGSTLVGSVQFGYTYYTTWNSSNNNYNPWTRTLANVSNGAYLTITDDASKIIYGGGFTTGGPVNYAVWNSTDNNYGPSIELHPGLTAPRWFGFSVTRDGGIIIMNSYGAQSQYVVYDPITHTYGNLNPIPTTSMHITNIRNSWLSYDNTTLYYIENWHIYQTSIAVQYMAPIIPDKPLYLGDDFTITKLGISFNNANVFVKTPITAQNVSHKGYVDVATTTLNTSINTESVARATTDSQLAVLVADLQAVNLTLSNELNAVYQYFLNQDRTGPVPTR